MLAVYPLPWRKVTGLRTNNPMLARKCELFDQVAYYSEPNDDKLFRFASLLRRSKANFLIETENIFDSAKKVELNGSAAAECFVLWNLAALLSHSLALLTTRDTHTKELFRKRLERIIHIFYYLKAEGVPSMTPNRVTDLSVQTCTFYHAVYSAHLYEFLLLTDVTAANYMCAAQLFEAADGINPTGKKQFGEKTNLLKLMALECHAKSEEQDQNYGSSIVFLKQAITLFDSCPRAQRKKWADWHANVKAKLAVQIKDNDELFHDNMIIATPLPTIEHTLPAINEGLDFNIVQLIDTKELDETLARITAVEKTLTRCADSFALLTTLVCECDSARKRANAQLFTDRKPTEARLFMLKEAEMELDTLFEWISVTKSTSVSVFELDESLGRLHDLKERLDTDLVPFIREIDNDEAHLVLDPVNEELTLLELPPSFEADLEKKTCQCLALAEKLAPHV